MLLMGSRGSKRTDADFRSGAIREIGPARKYASHDPKFAPAMGNEMARDGTRLALFIDGANAHATAKALGFDIDLQAPANGIPEPRHVGARVLLHSHI